VNGPPASPHDDAYERAQQVQPGESKLPWIWIAMMVSIVLYAVLTVTVVPSRTQVVDQELETWLLIFLAMGSGLHVLVVFLLRQMIAALSRASYVVYCVLRWALMEGIGVYGLLLSVLGVDLGITAIFYAVSLLLLASSGPGRSDRAVFVAQFR